MQPCRDLQWLCLFYYQNMLIFHQICMCLVDYWSKPLTQNFGDIATVKGSKDLCDMKETHAFRSATLWQRHLKFRKEWAKKTDTFLVCKVSRRKIFFHNAKSCLLFLFALLIFMVFWVISHLKFLFFPPQATIPKSIIFILLLTGFLNDCFGVWLYPPGVSYLGISKLAHMTYKLAWTIIQHYGNILRIKKSVCFSHSYTSLLPPPRISWNAKWCPVTFCLRSLDTVSKDPWV